MSGLVAFASPQCEKLRCEIASDSPLNAALLLPRRRRGPENNSNGLGRLSQGFSLFDHQTPAPQRLGFGGGVAFDMDEWGDERD